MPAFLFCFAYMKIYFNSVFRALFSFDYLEMYQIWSLKKFLSYLWSWFDGLNIHEYWCLSSLIFFQNTIFPSQVTNEHESLVVVKKLFATCISCITYLRGLFPESSYRDRRLDGKVALNDCFGWCPFSTQKHKASLTHRLC